MFSVHQSRQFLLVRRHLQFRQYCSRKLARLKAAFHSARSAFSQLSLNGSRLQTCSVVGPVGVGLGLGLRSGLGTQSKRPVRPNCLQITSGCIYLGTGSIQTTICTICPQKIPECRSLQYWSDLQTLTLIADVLVPDQYSTIWQHQGLDTVATDHASNGEQWPAPRIRGRRLYNVWRPLRVR